MRSMKYIAHTLLFVLIGFFSIHASVPVPYAGKVSINGVNFNGQLSFVFAIYNPSNSKLWDSGNNPSRCLSLMVAIWYCLADRE